MALMHIVHEPQTTKVDTPLEIILPDPGAMGDLPVRRRKVLYLLHGLSDDASAWQRFTNIEVIARQYGLVVVMPSVGRSFYADLPNGQAYFTYITQELPQYLSDVFDLRPAREDTLLAGLSMGGYGAIKCGLLYPERYAAIGAFSGVLSLAIFQTHRDDTRQPEFEFTFGDLSKLPGSAHDPAAWLNNAARNKTALPGLYVSCGTADDLLPLNRIFRDQCRQLGIPLAYSEIEGAKHNWLLWDAEIRRFLTFALGAPPEN
ncbi:MAG: alpha/beta hydrolase [Anaerolineae bacterium]